MMEDCTLNYEKVWYCADCLSLRVICIDEDECYCDSCGSTDIRQTTNEQWDKLYEQRNNVKYLNSKNNNGRESKKRF